MIKPLSKKTRFVFLISLLFLFLIIAPIIIAYSLGYKISDIDNVFFIEETGGIYIHSGLSNTRVYLNDEFVKTNGILLKNTLIQKLHPNQNYNIRVEKENYQTWSKDIFVYPSLVTEGRVLMLPTKITKREIFPFFDKNNLGTTTVSVKAKKVNNKFIPENIEYKNLMISFEDQNIYEIKPKIIATTTATTGKEISEKFIELGINNPDNLENLIENGNEISWLENGNIILNWIGSKNETPYYYCLDFKSCRQKIVLDWEDKIQKFDFLPGRSDVFLILVDSGLYAVEVDDRSHRNIQTVYTDKIDDFIIGPNSKVFVKNKEQIFELTF